VSGRLRGEHPLGIWLAGVMVGVRSLRREPVLGLKRLALPVSYWRSREFAYVWRQLVCPPGAHILDVGSPKDLAAMLARHRAYHVVATDILPRAVTLSERYARAQGLNGLGTKGTHGDVRSEVQDGRRLPYGDASFDAAYSVSVLEHIPDGGDTVAMRELLRVVRPGGVVVVTVPFDRRYRETFVQGPVYERKAVGSEPVFYRQALAERLMSTELADVVDLSYWGEGAVRMERILRRLGRARAPLYPLEGVLACLLRPVDPDGAGHPMAAFLTLRRR
jgi:SAM-dependent methyltransferase